MDYIKEIIGSKKVMLIMKGVPAQPACGFSAQVVEILNSYNIEYGHVNVLDDAEFRADIKQFSDWPTFPQLYVNSEFIGGADIVKEMFVAGELDDVLNG